MWKQLKPFNRTLAGTTKGYCLRNVRLGYSIASKYATALGAWNNTDQHKDRSFPAGDVPLFYSYKTDGHINVRLASGHVWSDGDIYASLDAYLAGHPLVHYLGWGERINGVKVFEWVADPVTPPVSIGQRLYFSPVGQTATFYPVAGGSYKMYIKDASYNWAVKENLGNKVRVWSKSAGGDCWVYLKFTSTGATIPGRYIK